MLSLIMSLLKLKQFCINQGLGKVVARFKRFANLTLLEFGIKFL